MNTQSCFREGLSRRDFLRVASAVVAVLCEGRVWQAWGSARSEQDAGDGVDAASTAERSDRLSLQLPAVITNGAKVPIVVEMAHPMESAHYITTVRVVNQRDPIPLKGEFHFTPANGQVYLAFQARMDHGLTEVAATAECSRHGRWSVARPIKIEGTGGCEAPAPPLNLLDCATCKLRSFCAGGCEAPAAPLNRPGEEQVFPPQIRIPELVKHGRIQPGQLIHVQVKVQHPSRTGLLRRDGKFVQESEPFYLKEMEVFSGDERVSRFVMTPALSDNPFITFKLRALREEPLRILLTNSRGQQFEATHKIHFS